MYKLFFKYILHPTLVIILLGCIGDDRYSLQSYEYLKQYIPSDLNKTNMSMPIILLGDTQEHEDFGTAVDDGKRIIDKLVTDVTRRTVQANLNSIEIMNTILKKNREVPIVHLGDFLDVSCHDEFTRAMNVLSSHDKWVVMLGNHDGYYLGNFLKSGKTANSWASQCDSGRFYEKLNYKEPKIDNYENALLMEINEYKPNRLGKIEHVRSYNKSTVIERYLSMLFRKNKEVSSKINYAEIFDQNHTLKNNEYFSKTINITNATSKIQRKINYTNNNKGAFIRKVYAYMNQCKFKSNLENCNSQKSFLLQKISLQENEIELILLDTSVYTKAPSNNSMWEAFKQRKELAGRVGNLTSNSPNNQIEILAKWLKENNDRNITTIFAGHHPLETITELKDFFKEKFVSKPVLYISAHTHQGFWKKWNNSVTELNVGSLIDAPIHYRTLQVKKLEDNKMEVFSQLKEFNLTTIDKLIGKQGKDKCKSYTNYFNSNYSYASPEKQETDYPYNYNMWESQHLKTLPYLSYYLKLLERKEIQESQNDFNLTISAEPKKRSFNKLTLITYLKNSIENFKKKINNKNYKIDNEDSCIRKVKDGKLTTQNCSRLLYVLKKDEQEIFKDFNQTFLINYKVCTALNAITIDANTSTMDIKDYNYKTDINTKWYSEVNKLYELEFENRKIEHIRVD